MVVQQLTSMPDAMELKLSASRAKKATLTDLAFSKLVQPEIHVTRPHHAQHRGKARLAPPVRQSSI